MRHPNDVKIFEGDIPDHNDVSNNEDNSDNWKKTNSSLIMAIIIIICL